MGGVSAHKHVPTEGYRCSFYPGAIFLAGFVHHVARAGQQSAGGIQADRDGYVTSQTNVSCQEPKWLECTSSSSSDVFKSPY